MHFVKKAFIIFAIIILPVITRAQFVEIGLLLGASNYLGDLSNESVIMKETHFAGGLYGRYNISPKWAVKGFGAIGQISGDDKNLASETRDYGTLKNFEFNKIRNLNFTSDIYEFSLQMEFNLRKNDLKTDKFRPFIPYIFGGIGVVNFNPKTTLNTSVEGQVFELQPLATEGQGSTTLNDLKKYDLTVLSVPLGIGFRQKVGKSFFIGVEGGIRITGTNYLDDVGGKYADYNIVRGATGFNAAALSDRSWELLPEGAAYPIYSDGSINGSRNFFKDGDLRSDKKTFKTDAYFITGITISYIFRGKGIPCPQF